MELEQRNRSTSAIAGSAVEGNENFVPHPRHTNSVRRRMDTATGLLEEEVMDFPNITYPPHLSDGSDRLFSREVSDIGRSRTSSVIQDPLASCAERLGAMESPARSRVGSSCLSWQEELGGELASMRTRSKSMVVVSPDGDSRDLIGLQRAHISLSEPGLLPWLCCQFPAWCMFSGLIALFVTAAYSTHAYFCLTAGLTIYVSIWTLHMSIFSAVGAFRMRRDAQIDWHSKLQGLQEEDPERLRVMHIVIIPNYKEDEDMLVETLENISRSPIAQDCIRVVLGMEAREAGAREKAERLIKVAQDNGWFSDIFAAFHPKGLPGELAGKSSNTQWAYREATAKYAKELQTWNPTKVFLSVGDADTLWHPQYFDALSYQGLTMPPEKAEWSIWQPPMLLFRNLFAVPGFTRLSGLGTLLFELSGLAGGGMHFCFSSYSMTYALASHKKIAGWDPDVVAEDHHMFCKCFFASLWEAAQVREFGPQGRRIEPKVSLRAVYLPAEGYLVESSNGYFESCYARFVQARRHAQGMAELGYALLQYLRLLRSVGGRAFSLVCHFKIWGIFLKMITVHIVNTVQAFALVLAAVVIGIQLISALSQTDLLSTLLDDVPKPPLPGVNGEASAQGVLTVTKWIVVAMFGPVPPVAILSASTMFMVVRDVVEGNYTTRPSNAQLFGGGDEETCVAARPAAEAPKTRLTCWQSFKLAAWMQHDMMFLAEPTVMLYGMLPAMLAAWSLLRQGTQFEYIVAAKPDSQESLKGSTSV
mmetsp:Transcript_23459/g.54703  ORF Transcript_23459/g.54703 Transcript_23459/m.54703 type:complete len:759 (+) Transcript_23459:62-2338(+)